MLKTDAQAYPARASLSSFLFYENHRETHTFVFKISFLDRNFDQNRYTSYIKIHISGIKVDFNLKMTATLFYGTKYFASIENDLYYKQPITFLLNIVPYSW